VPGDDPLAPVIGVAPPVIGVATLSTAVVMGIIAVGAARSRRMKPSVGTVGVPVPAGTTGVVQAPLGPVGTVHLGGETWTARTPDEAPLERDTPVRLVGFDGLTAIVQPLGPDETPTQPVAPAPLPADIP
jgi:membrane-bound serine protease (ClpP class)